MKDVQVGHDLTTFTQNWYDNQCTIEEIMLVKKNQFRSVLSFKCCTVTFYVLSVSKTRLFQ